LHLIVDRLFNGSTRLDIDLRKDDPVKAVYLADARIAQLFLGDDLQ
jgi:hypothetical protein